MADPVSAARAARENLARGLGALQSPGVPPAIMSVAEPIAHAMGALHRIEASNGAAIAEAGPAALNAMRHALATLQGSAGQHPAVDQALEAIAGSLSLVHGLAQPVAQPVMPQPPGVSPYAGTMPVGNRPPAPPARQASAMPPTQPSPAQAYGSRPEAPQQAAFAPPPPVQQWQPQAAPAPAPVAAPVAAPAPPRAAAPPAPAGSLRVEAELGAHSTTNFYKGLSGNDVIDSGGIFVATYQIPEIGRQLSIRVSMPGGYEFEALGVVIWTREAPESTSDTSSSPGFGAQFTQITPEGRQLVYRYVRNREPLFYDDL